ncbi:3-deoxy-7-phosphoheptulonate synthase, partial [Candidatus Peregrinibacteria bacterium]|nr:3-deoxy-7-phosphoheptulonate synthase [Candidatus Peregrinibacteria bacterium]
ADGFIVEVHPHPEEALSDAQQQLTPAEFKVMMKNIQPIIDAVGKTM